MQGSGTKYWTPTFSGSCAELGECPRIKELPSHAQWLLNNPYSESPSMVAGELATLRNEA
jgi:hypothetical protein